MVHAIRTWVAKNKVRFVRFGVLGPLVIQTRDDQAVALPGKKVRMLLAVMLTGEGRTVSSDRLIDTLWGESPPGNPLGALHTKIWQLRKVLDEAEPTAGSLILSNSHGYSLEVDDGDVDFRRFEEQLIKAQSSNNVRLQVRILGDALAEWRGPALADFAHTDFAGPIITRLEERRLTALEDKADAMLSLGEHQLLVGELGDLLARHPFRERLCAAYIRALYASGRQSEALAAFDGLRGRLDEELGLEPSAELISLRQAVLSRDPDLSPRHSPITTAARQVTNLPASVGALIGRDSATVQVKALIEASRLVTLHGVGGVGKTRLALEVGSSIDEDYPDGVWLVELSTLSNQPKLGGYSIVANSIASVLGVRDGVAAGEGRVTQVERLAESLRTKHTLLIFDNCEHVVEQVAYVSDLLLRAAPGLRILATSREPLGVPGERLWTVPALTIPANTRSIEGSSAAELFVARTSEVAPGFVLDEHTRTSVAEICRRLDGLPFALELAATRVRTLGVNEVAARLGHRFSLLTMGSRGAPVRQQTLRAAIDWSWDLLTNHEQIVLERLAVFSGGCLLTAAEDVCSGGVIERQDVPDLISRLVDRSLVSVIDVAGVRRFRLLESVHAYAEERLSDSGEEPDIRIKHARYYADLAEATAPKLRGPSQRRWLEQTNTESGNFSSALETAAASRDETELAFRIVNALAWHWFLSGRLDEANRGFEMALAVATGPDGFEASSRECEARAWQVGFALRAGKTIHPLDQYGQLPDRICDPIRRATIRWFLGFVRVGYGEQRSAEECVEDALVEFRAQDYSWGTAAALAALAAFGVLRGDLDTVRRRGEESLRLFVDLGDGWGQLQATDALAALAEVHGDYQSSAQLHRQGLRIAETLGLWNEVSNKLSGLGRISLLHGDYTQARELHERSMRLAAEQGYTFGEQFAEIGLGMAERRQGRLSAAEVHLLRWLEWCRQVEGGHGVALILAELGFIAEMRGDIDSALIAHREGYDIARSTGDSRAVALAVEGVACTYSRIGEHKRAALLLGHAESVREASGAPLSQAERSDVERALKRGTTAMGTMFDEIVIRGRGLEAAAVTSLVVD